MLRTGNAMSPFTFLLAGVGLCTGPIAQAKPYGDCHFHLLDFLQNGEFDNRDGAFPCDASGLMADGRYFQLPYGERHRKGFGRGAITLPNDFSLPERFGLETLAQP